MSVQIVITLQDNGEIQVQGPIENKVVMYGVLELAKEAVQNHNRSVIIPALPPLAGS